MSRRRRPRLAVLAASAALALTATGGAIATSAGEVAIPASVTPQTLGCVAPTDAAGIDAVLTAVGSPLAGRGADFVASATAVGLDPRALVAIAAHETLLMTYPPAQAINNPFGLGPNIPFPDATTAIRRAAQVLGRFYLAEGRDSIPMIGVKWAPVGVANDPTNLNQNWAGGVSAYYRALGGDPDRTLRLMDQDAQPACPASPTTPLPAPQGDPVLSTWNGALPTIAAPGMIHGGDPATGLPATIAGFTFPLAPPAGGQVRYDDDFAQPGAVDCYGSPMRCATTLTSAPGVAVVAVAGGALHAATEQEATGGIAFWLQTPDGDRFGYGGLAAYQPGIGEGAAVTAGQRLGDATGSTPVAWERSGVRVNPVALLGATRPSD